MEQHGEQAAEHGRHEIGASVVVQPERFVLRACFAGEPLCLFDRHHRTLAKVAAIVSHP